MNTLTEYALAKMFCSLSYVSKINSWWLCLLLTDDYTLNFHIKIDANKLATFKYKSAFAQGKEKA